MLSVRFGEVGDGLEFRLGEVQTFFVNEMAAVFNTRHT
jgi:hypothetical protein